MNINEFKKERNYALLSLDEEKIRAFYKKYNKDSFFITASSDVFWVAVHKAITGCLDLPLKFRKKSKEWLSEKGFRSFDDGDL